MKLVIRADASPSTGAGHAMRCLTLAAAWNAAGGEATLVGSITIDFVKARAHSLGVGIGSRETWPEGDVLIVDAYDLELRREGEKRGGFRTRVLVDDLGGSVPQGYHAIWNPNAYGSGGLYPGFHGEVLGGPEVVPIRDDLPQWQGRASGQVGIALGGGSIDPSIVQLLVALSDRLPRRNFISVGAWTPRGWREIPGQNPWAEMVDCDCALLAAGTTTWEAAQVGIPVAMAQTADNQQLVVAWVRAQGIPTVDLRRLDRSRDDHLEALLDALEGSRPLPPMRSGADSVARWLRESAGDSLT